MHAVGLRVIIGDEQHAVRPHAVIIIRGHLEIVAALHLLQKVARFFAVFLFGERVIVAETRRGIKRVALAGGNILPLHAVDVRRAIRLFLVVRDDQRHIRIFGHAEIAAGFAEKMHRVVFADVDVAAVLCALRLAVGLRIKRLSERQNAVDEILAGGRGGRLSGF